MVYHIATKFCTRHDVVCSVVPCLTFHSDPFTTTWMRTEWNFHRMWITMENSSPALRYTISTLCSMLYCVILDRAIRGPTYNDVIITHNVRLAYFLGNIHISRYMTSYEILITLQLWLQQSHRKWKYNSKLFHHIYDLEIIISLKFWRTFYVGTWFESI